MIRVDKEKSKNGRRRAVALVAVVALVFGAYALRLFQIQIVEGDEYARIAQGQSSTTLSIAASRGEILDRYLRPMSVNRTTLSIVFDYAFFPRGLEAGQRKLQNDIILKLTSLLTKAGEEWNDTLPITRTAPYAFEKDREDSVAALKARLRMAEYATADNCMAALVKQYKLEGYSQEEQRICAGVQYEMTEVRKFAIKNPFTFSNDVSKETSYRILENNQEFPGVDIEAVPVREYASGEIASHVIGTVGPIYAEEYEKLKEKGYALNDIVGKSGIESVMEDELRGTAGTRTLVKDATGKIVDQYESKAPVPGNSVVLTLDSNLQDAAQKALDKQIKALRAQTNKTKLNGHDVRSGAAVVIDVADGGVLACASWPFYNLATYTQDYANLLADPDNPLFNRALNGAFPCGSTMKPCVAMAGLCEHIITPTDTPVFCNRKYMFYASSHFTPGCLGYHRSLNVVGALAKSCNVFFYDLGRRLTIEKMNEYSKQFGLGQKTGIEIGEAQGVLAGREHSAAIGQTWTAGKTVLAAIGQDDNLFTPIQLAAYAMTLANDGVRYKTHIIQAIRSYDGQETPVEKETVVKMSLTKEAIDTVRKGMIEVVKSGTAASRFRGVNYTVAAKTGTAETGYKTRSDHGVFIAYAPVEKPEVAVAVVLENGTSGPSASVARDILDAYFSSKSAGMQPTPPEQLLP